MDSISSWYANKARRPLAFLSFLILIVQFSYLAFAIYANERRYSDLMENVSRVTGIALMQKNRVMLETLTYTISENPDFAEFYICQGGLAIVAFPPQKNGCLGKLKGGIFQKVEEAPIPGFAGFNMVSKVHRVKVPLGYLIVVVATLLISTAGIVLLTLVSRRFEREILYPIVTDFEDNAGEQIHEFKILKERRSQFIELEKGRAVAEMARQVAHDIRSPLSALQIFTEKKRSTLGADADMLTMIAERVVGIAESLLERSRELNAKASSIESLIEESRKIMEEKLLRFPGVKITVKSDVDGADGRSVRIDRLQWGRLVSNLIENSVEAATLSSAEVDLIYSVVDGQLAFVCADNGRGLGRDHIEKLMSTGGSIGKIKGNGIGLAHLKKVVAEGEGTWELSSEIGKGVKVKIFLPMKSI